MPPRQALGLQQSASLAHAPPELRHGGGAQRPPAQVLGAQQSASPAQTLPAGPQGERHIPPAQTAGAQQSALAAQEPPAGAQATSQTPPRQTLGAQQSALAAQGPPRATQAIATRSSAQKGRWLSSARPWKGRRKAGRLGSTVGVPAASRSRAATQSCS